MIYSCYATPNLILDGLSDFLGQLTEDAKQHFLKAGNFNSCTVPGVARILMLEEKTLLEAIATIDVVLLNSDDKTKLI